MGHGPADPDQAILHASCVSLAGHAVVITGASGSGKSALALQLMAYGARLVADDRTEVVSRNGQLWASAPETIKSKIEARGIGILSAEAVGHAQVVLAVDLDRTETSRLPHPRETRILGVSLPLCLRVEAAHFAPAILQYLREGRNA
ncbi:Hpr(Ser) kinase/phosphatase [Shimia isoporae]|uniref:Hpr(Ser) kinase/phosphatase n=1 Tax=Shimia isoporae TaxID=647720 RepID=A0A4V2Q247_9RHOB|nr:HPr kinase/phosphatase C-terminal domain-containing protein [Shimia isoporae]TCL01101.1 Hpr(Ser) kinase/phosphatase [Shimia isoporae]